MKLTFDADHVRALLAASRESERRTPTLGQVIDPAHWRDDIDADRRAALDIETAEDGLAFSATPDDVDSGKIEAGLILVGSEGVSLMSNAPADELDAGDVARVCYARECDPTTLPFDTWWDNKRRSFGGDDGSEFIPAASLEAALEGLAPGEPVMLEVTPQQIAIYGPAPRDDDPSP